MSNDSQKPDQRPDAPPHAPARPTTDPTPAQPPAARVPARVPRHVPAPGPRPVPAPPPDAPNDTRSEAPHDAVHPIPDDAVREVVQADLARAEDADMRASDQLDRLMLVGGPAAILASVSFLKDIAPAPAPHSLWWLGGAWVALLGSSAVGAGSLVASRTVSRLYAKYLRAQLGVPGYTFTEADHKHLERRNAAVRRMTKWGLSLFVVGILLLVVFATINLPEEKGSVSNTPVQTSDIRSISGIGGLHVAAGGPPERKPAPEPPEKRGYDHHIPTAPRPTPPAQPQPPQQPNPQKK